MQSSLVFHNQQYCTAHITYITFCLLFLSLLFLLLLYPLSLLVLSTFPSIFVYFIQAFCKSITLMVNSITKDKCNVCCRKVQKRHKAIQCDICQYWVHIKCNFLDDKTYKKLQTSSYPWYCLTCLKSRLPFSTITNENLYVTQKGLSLNPISTMNTPNESALNMMSSLNIFSDQESQDEDITPCKYYEPIELNGLKQSKHKHHLNTLHLHQPHQNVSLN